MHFNHPTIVGIIGLQGAGKTMLLTAFGYEGHKEGKQIYANYSLKYPYTPITSFEDIEYMRRGIFLADEFWLWCFARSSMSKINQDLAKIIMLNRKRGISIFYTAQQRGQADKLLRNVTNYWIYPQIRPIMAVREEWLTEQRDKIEKLGRHPSKKEELEQETQYTLATIESLKGPQNYQVMGEIYNAYDQYIGTLTLEDLSHWGSYFNTYEEIGSLHRSRQIPYTLTEGIELEKHFVAASNKIQWIESTDHLPDSGRGTGKKFDVILKTHYGDLGIDVKTTNQTRVSVYPEYLQKQILNAHANQLIPFIAFPKQNIDDKKIDLDDPENWLIHPIENSYVLGLRTPPKYGKLAENSYSFPKLDVFLKNLQ